MRVIPKESESVISGSGQRALLVLEVILKNGPIKPAQICQKSGLGRTSVHRAIHLLVEQGWVRHQLGDRACVATYRFDQLAVDANFSQPIQDEIYPVIKELCAAHYLHGDIAFLFGAGRIRLVESTDSKIDMNTDLSLVSSDIATAIYSIMEPAQITRLTSRALQEIDARESEEIVSGNLAKRVLQARQNKNLAWSADRSMISIPFQDKTQLFGAVRLRQKISTRTAQQILLFVASELRRSLPGVFKPPTLTDK
jgi:DNA-binding IclR family transcriptional regulator